MFKTGCNNDRNTDELMSILCKRLTRPQDETSNDRRRQLLLHLEAWEQWKRVGIAVYRTGENLGSSLKYDTNIDIQTELEDVPPIGALYIESNHVLVNLERMNRGIPSLMRILALDGLAQSIAMSVAKLPTSKKGRKEKKQRMKLIKGMIPSRYHGNIFQGHSVNDIHKRTMRRDSLERRDILSARFQQFGMGTRKRDDGVLVLCQLFTTIGRCEI
jgi:hypothetical protein